MSQDEIWRALAANHRIWLSSEHENQRETALRAAIVNVNLLKQPGYGAVARPDLEAHTAADFIALIELRIHNRALSELPPRG